MTMRCAPPSNASPTVWKQRPISTGAPALNALAAADSLTTIGRGPTLAIAREAALKLKETCNLQAEPFSSAEFQHGPMALVSERLSDAGVRAD